MKALLAIDQSTSATKAIVFDPHGAAVSRASREHRQIYPQPGWVEHDPEQIWQNTLDACRDALAGAPEAEIVGVCITNQRETILAFDRATGRPLMNALVWQDRRGDALCAELRTAGHDPTVTARTGLKIDSYFSASKIAWMMRNAPDVASAVRAGTGVVGTIDSYLIHRLTAGETFATDTTNASRTLLFDIRAMCWDAELCALFDCPIDALPEVRDATARFGETTLGGLLAAPVPVCGVIGDSQAALFAHRCFDVGEGKVTLGTGSSVLLNLGPRLPEASDAVLAVAWSHAGRPTYCAEGLVNFSAGTFNWLRDQLKLVSSTEQLASLAGSVPDSGGVYLVPAFAGLSTPYWQADARGAIVGLSAHSTQAYVARAAIESVAFQLRDVFGSMHSALGTTLSSVHVDGGASRNEQLVQLIADQLGVSLVVSEMPDCSALGAAMAGLLGLGMVQSLDDLRALPQSERRVSPAPDRKRPDRDYAGWQRAVRQVLAGLESR